jgi:hypothetical protein
VGGFVFRVTVGVLGVLVVFLLFGGFLVGIVGRVCPHVFEGVGGNGVGDVLVYDGVDGVLGSVGCVLYILLEVVVGGEGSVGVWCV